ncbi:MAG: RNA polymerase sigma factor [Chitinophagaceae bacterium]|uniref:RNA polymerase sigma factor n=1 Tax=Sediminibacterium sp. TaxID=1917865 RepID=UPI001BC0ADEA|nr:RNA polymerase sigma factor [Sediminibacterium sp.]MBS4064053.1 RNA polymerase sigma factor [Chitinophagaceae bacterium]MDZ4073103.1 RNA polymerase sigma factor [Sediminibacterium sp.]
MAKIDNSTIFIAVIEANKGILYKVANSYCKDFEDRNDLVQEIILKLWQAFDTYNDEFKHSTWIYRIALNTAISNYRKEKVRKKYFTPLSGSILEWHDVDNTAEKEHKYQLLQQFILELKDLDKALLLLYLDEKNYKEIAEILGISESNVGTKISRLKNLLKDKFIKENL